jgi:hypothetical protein
MSHQRQIASVARLPAERDTRARFAISSPQHRIVCAIIFSGTNPDLFRLENRYKWLILRDFLSTEVRRGRKSKWRF